MRKFLLIIVLLSALPSRTGAQRHRWGVATEKICNVSDGGHTFGSAGANSPQRPYPQHTTYFSGTIRPNNVTQQQLDDSTSAFYDRWRARYLKNDCAPDQYYVHYDEDATSLSVSEGQGYGMMITAIMAGYDPNAQIYFDGLYRYSRAHPSAINRELMAYKEMSCATDSTGSANAATDGDMDVAFALLLADNQWGSQGLVNYLQEARRIIDAIMQDEINHDTWSIKLGDWSNSSDPHFYYGTRSSDFIIDHFRIFQPVTGDSRWTNVIEKSYALINQIQIQFSPNSGLTPDFIEHTDSNPTPAMPNYLESVNDGYFYYNACRVPWRIGLDYLIAGEPRAKTALNPLNASIRSHTNNNPAMIRSGYKLDGTDISGNNYSNVSFTGPLAVAAMIDSSNQSWLNDLWAFNLTYSFGLNKYYENALKMLTMIAVSGNWWEPHVAPMAVSSEIGGIPSHFVLEQNYPNPFNSSTVIEYEIPKWSEVHLAIYDLTGKCVSTLVHQYQSTGVYRLNLNFESLSSGTYYYRIEAGFYEATKPLLFIK